ncbi:hypothetical protein M407DRAFT_22833 [Tulasnella calospora MUT 4182]|uniref:Winged helix-turn helix domain-containing protein n=1 Tax=Tulasnella calospora MUT 4182 TaxID=1051891 RepID=A0A0C3QKK8_9AGAM|nr:hypothetical protein M407DRAFT_22833 [Tulasnella calospora MUT 4182]
MLDELPEHLEQQQGKQVSISTIEQTLKQVGYALKKITPVAIEQNEDVCQAFACVIGQYEAL